MVRLVAKVRGLGLITWRAKHEVFHMVLGALWTWVLVGIWRENRAIWFLVGMLSGLLPDLDHVLYFLTYGRKDPYTTSVFSYIHAKQWQRLVVHIAHGHKGNTNLMFHNVYTVGVFICISVWSYTNDWKMGAVIFGAIVSHYLYDMIEDLVLLGKLNSNWKRLGRPKKSLRLRI